MTFARGVGIGDAHYVAGAHAGHKKTRNLRCGFFLDAGEAYLAAARASASQPS